MPHRGRPPMQTVAGASGTLAPPAGRAQFRLACSPEDVGRTPLMRRSGAAFVRTALLKKEVAQSRQRVRHKLRLLLLRSQHQPKHDAMTRKARHWCRTGADAPGLNFRRPDLIDMAPRLHPHRVSPTTVQKWRKRSTGLTLQATLPHSPALDRMAKLAIIPTA